MAQRFGGKYSPGSAQGMRRSKAGAKVNLLFLAPIPLLFAAFTSSPDTLLTKLLAFGALMLAAWLTREGLRAEDAYAERQVAKRPAIPRKMFGSVLTGLGLALAGVDTTTLGLVVPAIYFVLGTGLHFMAFGPDPMKDKGATGIDSFQVDRVAKALDQAEEHLAAMADAIRRSGVPALDRRVRDFASTARGMFRVVEEDPRDLTSARRFLGVYLLGAKDATVQFADLYARSKNDEARKDYEKLLDDLENSFTQKTEKLLLDDKSALDVEIEVLRERLEREGVRR